VSPMFPVNCVTYLVRANMGADITVNRNFAAPSPAG